jgi:hypothetical protein
MKMKREMKHWMLLHLCYESNLRYCCCLAVLNGWKNKEYRKYLITLQGGATEITRRYKLIWNRNIHFVCIVEAQSLEDEILQEKSGLLTCRLLRSAFVVVYRCFGPAYWSSSPSFSDKLALED